MQEFNSYEEAQAAALPSEWPNIIRVEYERDAYGNTKSVKNIWANYLIPYRLRIRDRETDGPYRGTYSDEAVGF